jgi:hypothetical protein
MCQRLHGLVDVVVDVNGDGDGDVSGEAGFFTLCRGFFKKRRQASKTPCSVMAPWTPQPRRTGQQDG